MKYLTFVFCAISLSGFAQKIHFKSILVDTHNDAPTACIEKKVSFDQDLTGINHSDLKRFKEGGLDYQLFSIWCDGDKKNPYAWAMREMDTLDAVAARNPDKMVVAKDWKTIQAALKAGKIVAQYGVEGGHMIEDDINRLDTFYNRGVRYMTLTWNNSPSWASSHTAENSSKYTGQKGLNDFGKQIIQRMNQLGMIVDISHVGEATFWDAIKTTTKPVIASHSNAYTICPVTRNLKDEQIDAVGKNGGVIQLNFYSAFIDSSFKNREKISETKKLSLRETLSNKKSDLIRYNSSANEKQIEHSKVSKNELNKIKEQIRQTIKHRKKKENIVFGISFFFLIVLLILLSKRYNVF